MFKTYIHDLSLFVIVWFLSSELYVFYYQALARESHNSLDQDHIPSSEILFYHTITTIYHHFFFLY